jgi:pyrophosphate--fructose-6-phosphate 1-phosphotransferase
MMQMETRKGRPAPVIAKALVRLDGAPFRTFAAARERWAAEDAYRYPGAIQYFGPPAVAGGVTETLRLESGDRGDVR